MESVCYLKVIDSLVRSTMDTATSGLTPISVSSCTLGRTKTDLKRSSVLENSNDCNEQLSPVKQIRSDYFETARRHTDVKFTVSDRNIQSYDGLLMRDNNCETSGVPDRKVIDRLRLGKDIYTDIAQSPETLTLRRSRLTNDQLSAASVIRSWNNCDGNLRCQSFPSLQTSCHHTSRACDSSMNKDNMMNAVGSELRVKRCRSLPCRTTPDIYQDGKLMYFVKEQCQSQYGRMSEVSTENATGIGNQFSYSSQQSDISDTDSDTTFENGLCRSTLATPSSCIIDVESDVLPCSPLNLTVMDNEFQLNGTGINQDIPFKNVSKTFTETDDEYFSKIGKCNQQFHRNPHDFETEKHIGESPATEKPQEKKINFSIDAILRPDFGVANTCNQLPASFQRCPAQTVSPRLRGTIKSFHSAFTAVDLSTRSRSDSLSSPSCSSSSSPSPPLSTSSPSPRLKPDFIHPSMFEKHIGQENFLFTSRLFQEPHKELENFFNGRIPFINSLHTTGFGNFPFMYTPQSSPQSKCSADRGSYRHQYTQDHARSKTDQVTNDISKLLSRPLYSFAGNSPNCTSEMLKVSRNHASQLKTGNDSTLQVLRHNKQGKNPIHLTSTIKPSVQTQFQEKNEAKPVSRVETKVIKSDNDTSANCKIELKKEKSGQNHEKSGDSSGKTGRNPVWPAWVFCTRYSDRPSSGPRSRKPKRSKAQDEKRPRTAFTNDQLIRLKREFEECRYLTETRRRNLADELGLTESQIKIWFQNKRAKIKKSVGVRNPLALQLMEQGLYNHSTNKISDDSS